MSAAQARQLAVSENAGLLFHPSGSVVQARARPAPRRAPRRAPRAGQGRPPQRERRCAGQRARCRAGGCGAPRAGGSARPAGPSRAVARRGCTAGCAHMRAGASPGYPGSSAARAAARHAPTARAPRPGRQRPRVPGAPGVPGPRARARRRAVPGPGMQRSRGAREGGGARRRCWTWQRASCGVCCGATWTPSAASATTPACRRVRACRTAAARSPAPPEDLHAQSSASVRHGDVPAGRTLALVLPLKAACLCSAPLCASRCLRPWAVQGPGAAGAGPPRGPCGRIRCLTTVRAARSCTRARPTARLWCGRRSARPSLRPRRRRLPGLALPLQQALTRISGVIDVAWAQP